MKIITAMYDDDTATEFATDSPDEFTEELRADPHITGYWLTDYATVTVSGFPPMDWVRKK